MKNNDSKTALEAALETTEVFVDVITSNELLASVPVIGTAIKLLSAADSIRDRAYAMKLLSFSRSLSNISEKERLRFLSKLQDNPQETRRVGETLFLVLDGLVDMDKPEVLGCVFVAFLRGIISESDLRILSHAISMSYPDDLKYLLEASDNLDKSQVDWMRRLSSSGLAEPVAGNTYGDIGQIYYKVTGFGEKLRIAYVGGRSHVGG